MIPELLNGTSNFAIRTIRTVYTQAAIPLTSKREMQSETAPEEVYCAIMEASSTSTTGQATPWSLKVPVGASVK